MNQPTGLSTFEINTSPSQKQSGQTQEQKNNSKKQVNSNLSLGVASRLAYNRHLVQWRLK
jgi:hypothetical protein